MSDQRAYRAELRLGSFVGPSPEIVAKDVFAWLDATSATNLTIILIDEQTGQEHEVDLTQFEIADLLEHIGEARCHSHQQRNLS